MSDKSREPDPAGETADEGGGTYGEVQPGTPVTPPPSQPLEPSDVPPG